MADDLDKMFQEVIGAVRQGQRARAKDLLSRLLRADQSNAEYWVWMSAVVDSASERQYCLQTALKLDPNHAAARRGLIMIGALPADNIAPVAPPKRKWSSALESQAAGEAPKSGLAGLWQKLPPIFRARPVVLGFLGVTAFLCLGIGGCLAGVLLQPKADTFAYNTVAPVTPNWETDTPTPSSTFTPTPLVRTSTPTLSGATPLAALLKVTYTPTARYIATPHNISEAFQSGLKAYDKGSYADMLRNMQQAGTEMPADVDVMYYRAEALRLLTRYEEAIEAYSQIATENPNFAPAYLGRGRAQMALKDNASVIADLDQAIELDPNFVEAYLDRASYRLGQADAAGAMEDLQAVEGLNAEHPLLYVLRAQANLQLGENEQALEDALRAYKMDLTLLPAYLALANAYLANEQPSEALTYIRTYLLYEKYNPEAWQTMGITLYQLGKDYPAALDMLDQALELDDQLAGTYHYRGLTYLALDDAKSAVNDLVKAVRASPGSFVIGLDLGRALFVAERYTDSVQQFTAALKLAETDTQRASVYYWRAQVYQAAGNQSQTIKEWEALLALPDDNLPPEWLKQAREGLLALTPTPKLTATP